MTQPSTQSDGGMRVREAFLAQAAYCDQLGSPFTAVLCRTLGAGLDRSSAIEAEILAWRGDPGPHADSVPLRVAGALHYLVRAGRAGALAALYPPHAMPDPARLLLAARGVLQEQAEFVRGFLRHPPQTNEVGRSAAIIAGWLEIAARTRRPVQLFELGASAGLNLIAERYAYQFGAVSWLADGDAGVAPHGEPAALTLQCGWKGASPAVQAPLTVRSRRGCDRHPLNVADPAQRERLMAYVWADQTERLERLEAAIMTLCADPITVERADAADWIESVLPSSAEPGVTRVVFHSVFWSYLDRTSQERIAGCLAGVGAAASRDAPLAWLRLELGEKDEPALLRLTLWPGGADELLARVHPHGAWIRWER
ncbi:MAG: DUF2332 domain-containing protein [Steroidobacteraceae bacterium]